MTETTQTFRPVMKEGYADERRREKPRPVKRRGSKQIVRTLLREKRYGR